MNYIQDQNFGLNELNIDDSIFEKKDASTKASVNDDIATKNKKMFLSSKLENFKIEIGPKVIEACLILRNVSTFTSDNEPIDVEMTKKQLKKFVKLHEHFGEDDPWDKEDPYWTNKFFLKMSENEFKQLCWSADFLDSKRFLHSAAIYILSKIRDMKVEDIQNYLNIVCDYNKEEKNVLENNPLKYFASIAVGKNSHDLQMPGEDVYQINPNFTTNLFPLKSHHSKTDVTFQHQNFTFPQSLMNFTFTYFKIPSHYGQSYLFFKLYSTCKYFFSKLKIIPCNSIVIGIWLTQNVQIINANEIIDLTPELFKSFNANLYPFEQLYVHENCLPETFYNVLKKIIPQKINSISIFNKNLVLSVKEFKILFLNVDKATLCLKVIDKNGDTVPMEELLNYLPNVQNFKYEPANSECYTSKTAQKIAALKRDIKFQNFTLHYPPPNKFNAEHFAEFIKNHVHPTYKGTIALNFDNNIDEEIISNFYSVVVKVIDTWKYPSTKPKFFCANFERILFTTEQITE